MRHFLAPAAATVAALAAAPAAAQCLTEADLGRGVVVRFENGDYTTMRRTADGYQQIEEHYANGDPPMRFRAHRGIYFVEEYELAPTGEAAPGSRLVIEFQTDPEDLPDPRPGTSWTGPTVNLFDDGTTRNEIATVTYTAGRPVTLSGCTYDTIDVDIRYDWGADGWLQLDYAYLPEVGTAFIRGNQFEGETPTTTTAVAMDLASK